MILVKTRYETYNSKLLAIVEAFKTWRHYLEGCKHKVFGLTDYNNLWQFMETKSLSSRQVCWAKKLSYYYFLLIIDEARTMWLQPFYFNNLSGIVKKKLFFKPKHQNLAPALILFDQYF